jgi:tryptophan-rich sensory protein
MIKSVPRDVAVAALLALCVAILGGLATDIGPWYRGLLKPSFQPPDWLFGPAWTLIYTLITAASVVAWRGAQNASARRSLLILFGFNLALNVLWSLLFFRARRPDWALVEVVFLWASIAALIWTLYPRSRLAAWLLVPYLSWVTFASLINMAVVQLNAPFHG